MFLRELFSKIKQNKKSRMIIALVLIVLAIAAVGTTIAYLTHSTGETKNDFAPSEITCQIDETVEDGIKSEVTVKNNGKTSAYIRAAVIANALDEEGAITGAADLGSSLAGEGWFKYGAYYYYTQPVAPNGSTENLLKDSIDLTDIQVTVLAEAIESQPASAAGEAWGVAISTDSVEAYSAE